MRRGEHYSLGQNERGFEGIGNMLIGIWQVKLGGKGYLNHGKVFP